MLLLLIADNNVHKCTLRRWSLGRLVYKVPYVGCTCAPYYLQLTAKAFIRFLYTLHPTTNHLISNAIDINQTHSEQNTHLDALQRLGCHLADHPPFHLALR